MAVLSGLNVCSITRPPCSPRPVRPATWATSWKVRSLARKSGKWSAVSALTTPTSFGLPRRTGNGIDFNRLLLVTAVLTKRVGVKMGNQDIMVNVAGGLKVGEPAADLGVALAISSSFRWYMPTVQALEIIRTRISCSLAPTRSFCNCHLRVHKSHLCHRSPNECLVRVVEEPIVI